MFDARITISQPAILIYSQFEREIELDSGRIRIIVTIIRLFALYMSSTFAHVIATDILTPYERVYIAYIKKR